MKKQKYKNGMRLLVLLLLLLLPGCAARKQETEERRSISVAALKGPTALGMLKLMEDAGAGTTANDYLFTVAGAADELTAGLLKGEYALAAIPCNLASVLYNKSEGGITMLGINTLGVLYIVETGNTVQDITDLKGKTIYSTGKGTTPEYTLRRLLAAAGLEYGEEVTVEYCSEAAEAAARLSETDGAIALLPQPFVTTVLRSNDKARIALDVTAEWERLAPGTTVVTGVLVANTAYLQENPEEIESFLEEYAASAEFTVTEIEKASVLAEKYGILKEEVARQAIPYCNIVFLEGAGMKKKAEAYLQVLYEQNPASIGGKLPAEDFYFQR